jgi:hypothetical protein
MRDLKISVVGMFRSKEHGRVFHEHELYTMSVSLLDVSNLIAVWLHSQKSTSGQLRTNANYSLSHSITIVPDE